MRRRVISGMVSIGVGSPLVRPGLKCDRFLKRREGLASELSFLLPVINLLNPIEKHTSHIT